MAAGLLRRFEPDFFFIYLEGVDQAGHAGGWMSRAYLEALEIADAAVGIVREALADTGLDKKTAVILHSDHGGSGHHHQERRAENLTVPWIASGPGIRSGITLSTPVSVLDTAPTLARILGIPAHYSWEGRPVKEIFEAARVGKTSERRSRIRSCRADA
jgi:predicted AlkP superfamily pyrophosphatase or phosphodiesterase